MSKGRPIDPVERDGKDGQGTSEAKDPLMERIASLMRREIAREIAGPEDRLFPGRIMRSLATETWLVKAAEETRSGGFEKQVADVRPG